MMKTITQALLTGSMGFAWDMITAGERIHEYSQGWDMSEASDIRAGFIELSIWRTGRATVAAGERLELWVNAVAMRLGYNDGEVSGLVVWPLTQAC